ncbi:uncharacterized protein BP5553_02776 [Venustampulla echinocandica]|uniref:Uncharacterized protein n=1 Tax=Venustampulla echinocandica TaxID=2656787 RepID=A0A370TSD2_9HELO|nr:uncharacterized protein BP5553_02776 [Venustampulla echinocandica]RDL38436.1 hypothetical protein BP5553_02776 [Venustampulla echinocandica]
MSSSKDKGKGPQKPTDNDNLPPNGPPSQDQDPSLLSRITASASTLSRSAFTGAPTRNELHATARSALPGGNKTSSSSNIPGGSGSGSSAWAESSRAQQQPSHLREGGFRGVGDSEAHTSLSEQEFSSFLDGIDSFTPSSLSEEKITGLGGDDALKPNWDENHNALVDAWSRSQHPPLTSNLQNNHDVGTTVQEQQLRDGEEVLAILSAPDFLMEEQFSLPSLEDESPPNWGLSHEQISQIRTLMNEIFPPEPSQQHVEISADHPLNLAPALEMSGLETQDEALQAREHWREQWEGVLTRYTDEVWGELLPLVKEARKEVEEMRDEQKPMDETPKALRRLGAILGHLRNNDGSRL